MDKMNDSFKLLERRVARFVEVMFSEIQKAAQNSSQKVNTEIKNLQDQLAT